MTNWLSRQIILAVHDEQLRAHGGASGIRDEGLLESALARPLNLAGDGQPDTVELAATYALAIARPPPSSTATSARPTSPWCCSWR